MNIHTYIRTHDAFGECLFAENGIIEIGIPLELGIRIVHFSRVGERNVFYEEPAETLLNGWNVYGGHRLWIAPECETDYLPDNAPVTYRVAGDTVRIFQKRSDRMPIDKSITLRLDGDSVYVTHQVRNRSLKPLVCSLWSITAMAGGGVEYIDLPTRVGGLDPLHHLSVWDHTSMGDPRMIFEKDRIIITHMPIRSMMKIGVGHPIPSVRYAIDGYIFTKQFEICPSQPYPDGGVSYETFANQNMVEMESLSPLRTVLPFFSAEHKEVWSLRYQ